MSNTRKSTSTVVKIKRRQTTGTTGRSWKMNHACVIHSLLQRALRTVVQVLGSVRLPRGPIHLVEDLHVHEQSRSIVVLHFLMTRVNPSRLPSSRECTAQLLRQCPPAALCRPTCCRHRGGRRHRAFCQGLASSFLVEHTQSGAS
ncbi:unnamed protein product [Ectocarpus sp. 12 AP-2014]